MNKEDKSRFFILPNGELIELFFPRFMDTYSLYPSAYSRGMHKVPWIGMTLLLYCPFSRRYFDITRVNYKELQEIEVCDINTGDNNEN